MSSLFMFNTKMEQWLREIAIDAKFPSINHYKVSWWTEETRLKFIQENSEFVEFFVILNVLFS